MVERVDVAKKEHYSLATENQLFQKYINNSSTSTATFGNASVVAGGNLAGATGANATGSSINGQFGGEDKK
jgi:hypothetical protein